ncbi:collagen-like protein [Flagellimonas pacifica]|uniref:Collagen-like protein n=1 Tax=Flagellimonas pacifica TaxID=1247520 RepID=A0A285MGU3_9FLAO|nr:collagen-like protein [Allomuricauda parva]SNY95176.1 hypothetical protein SAMN06265377_0842 [Allomuricauda parva]
MKGLKLFSMAMLAMAVTMVSCSGEDGETGAQGIQGPIGEQGPQGPVGSAGDNGDNCWDLNGNGTADFDTEDSNNDGEVNALDCQGMDGTNGNANVIKADLAIGEFFSDNKYTTDFETVGLGITNEEVANYTYLFYLIGSAPANRIFPIPGALISNNTYARVVYDELGNLDIFWYNTDDDTPHTFAPGTYTFIRVVAIENSVLTGKNGNGDVMASLKAAGVDTNDYEAVASYFDLED